MKSIDIKHFLVRLIIVLAIPLVTIVVAMYLIIPCIYNTESDKTYAGILTVFIVILEIFALMGGVLLEAVWLHVKKKIPKRNSNLLILIIFAIYTVVHIVFLRQ